MSKTKEMTSMPRSQKLRVETGPEREKQVGKVRPMFAGDEMKGGTMSLSHSITSDNKVKRI